MHRPIRRLAVAALLAALALQVTGCRSPEERLAHHMARGEAFVRDNEIDAALLEFQSALNAQPNNAGVYERIGDVLMEYSQLYPQAISYYREAHRLDPNRIHSIVREARLLALEDPERARSLLDRAIALDPDDGAVLRAKAFFALVANDLPGARKAAERAIELDPSPMSYAELGAVYLAHIARDLQNSRFPAAAHRNGALQAYAKVNELKGGNYHRAILEQARVHGLSRRRSQAHRSFRQAIELAKEEGAAETQLVVFTAVEYARRERDRELERFALRAMVDVDEDHYQAWRELAEVTARRPNQSSDEILQELLAKRPDDGQAWLLWADHLARTDRARNARTDLRRLIDRGIDDPAVYEALIRLELRLGSVERARALLDALEHKEPDARVTQVASARLAIAEGRPEDAERLLTSLVRSDPFPELLRLLALAHMRQGEPAEARKVLLRAQELSGEPSVPLLRLLAEVDMGGGNWLAAMGAYIEMLKRRATLSDAERVNFAIASYHTGNVEKAQDVLRDMLRVAAPVPQAAVAYAQLFGADDGLFALGSLYSAHRRAPGNAEVIREMTRLELRYGKNQRALDRLNALIQKRQAGPLVIFSRAEVLADAGAYAQAEADALLAFEADPTLIEAVDLLHSLYRAQGKLDSARLAFEEADAAGVLHPGARLLLARLLVEDGEVERAQAMLERVVEENPEIWVAQAELAYLLADQGKELERAFRLARIAHIASKQGAHTSDVLGFVLLKSGKSKPALEQFQRAIAVASRNGDTPPPTFHYHAGLAYRALDRDDEAAESFRTALGQGEFPQAEEARRQLEAARHHAGDTGSSS
ncbi:MAG: tetratricopeptide repeat protein [Myxococcota bacterium]